MRASCRAAGAAADGVSEAVGWCVTAAGAALVVLTLLDVGRTVWHPSARGRLSSAVLRTVWAWGRRLGRAGRPWAGSGAVATAGVLSTWALLLLTGWALVYWPHVPQGFSYAPGLEPGQRSALLDAFYVSVVGLTTLGLGDVVPRAGWLRVALPLQALVGFALLSAAVSWVVQLFPALGRRRALAVDLDGLAGSSVPEHLAGLDSSFAAALLDRIAVALAQIRSDLHQYGETLYFADTDPGSSLPERIEVVGALVEAGARSARPDVRLAARRLGAGLDQLADGLRPHLGVPDGSTDDVLRTYVREHGVGRRW